MLRPYGKGLGSKARAFHPYGWPKSLSSSRSYGPTLAGQRDTSKPSILFLDDLHWADAASLDFLSY